MAVKSIKTAIVFGLLVMRVTTPKLIHFCYEILVCPFEWISRSMDLNVSPIDVFLNGRNLVHHSDQAVGHQSSQRCVPALIRASKR
jgi:hypothetical protein